MIGASGQIALQLFEKRIRDHLIDNNSNVVAAAACRQLANGLVESH